MCTVLNCVLKFLQILNLLYFTITSDGGTHFHPLNYLQLNMGMAIIVKTDFITRKASKDSHTCDELCDKGIISGWL